jgi:hypothetical protein
VKAITVDVAGRCQVLCVNKGIFDGASPQRPRELCQKNPSQQSISSAPSRCEAGVFCPRRRVGNATVPGPLNRVNIGRHLLALARVPVESVRFRPGGVLISEPAGTRDC